MISKFLFLVTTVVAGMTLGVIWPSLWTIFMAIVAGVSFTIGEWGHYEE